MCWYNPTRGSFNPDQKRFFKSNSKYEPNGKPDIEGVMIPSMPKYYPGRLFTIEVKIPEIRVNAKIVRRAGTLTDTQKEFNQKLLSQNVIAIVAYSVKDVYEQLFCMKK